jgi:hypothetical protein
MISSFKLHDRPVHRRKNKTERAPPGPSQVLGSMVDGQSVFQASSNPYDGSATTIIWADEGVLLLLNGVIEAYYSNMNKPGLKGFSDEVWARVIRDIKLHSGRDYTITQCQNQFSRLLKHYNEFKRLKETEGVDYDPYTHTLSAEPEFWREYIKAKPRYKIFINKPFKFLNEIRLIEALQEQCKLRGGALGKYGGSVLTANGTSTDRTDNSLHGNFSKRKRINKKDKVNIASRLVNTVTPGSSGSASQASIIGNPHLVQSSGLLNPERVVPPLPFNKRARTELHQPTADELELISGALEIGGLEEHFKINPL